MLFQYKEVKQWVLSSFYYCSIEDYHNPLIIVPHDNRHSKSKKGELVSFHWHEQEVCMLI